MRTFAANTQYAWACDKEPIAVILTPPETLDIAGRLNYAKLHKIGAQCESNGSWYGSSQLYVLLRGVLAKRSIREPSELCMVGWIIGSSEAAVAECFINSGSCRICWEASSEAIDMCSTHS